MNQPDLNAREPGQPASPVKPVRVWDVPVRLLHWALLSCVVASWVTSDSIGEAHANLGYGAAAIVAVRVLWGFAGSHYARFCQFVRRPAVAMGYARDVAGGHAARYVGHNPLGGWMVLALMSCIGLLALTGFIANTDLLWGYAWPVLLHTVVAWTLVALAALHVGGVLFTSWQHRENLIAAMITGLKKPAQPGDVD